MPREVVIVGGGLAGLTAALTLARSGIKPLVLEKAAYPRQKVCGEYVSLEVKPLLEQLGAYPESLNPIRIDRFLLSTVSGKELRTPLPLGAFSLSRYALDAFLAEQVRNHGVAIRTGDRVERILREADTFLVETAAGLRVKTPLVLGCQGKRSRMETCLRKRPRGPSPWIGVKQHVEWDMPAEEVQLHLFEQGYCGVSRVESGVVNLCYLVHRKQVQRCGGLEHLEKRVLNRNPALAAILGGCKRLWSKPEVIANVSFAVRSPVENGILFAGDAAGLISPLCGNGMAMAIQAGYELGKRSQAFLEGQCSREAMEESYSHYWKQTFSRRLRWGSRLQSLFWRPLLLDSLVQLGQVSPHITRRIIAFTHGKSAHASLAHFA